MNTSRHFPLRAFLFAFALLSAQHSMYAQTANTTDASTNLRYSVKQDDVVRAKQAVARLEQLKADVLVYRSYGAFESDGRLARVPLETFTDKLNQVTAEVESILPQLSNAKLRGHLSNSLYSYRDGAFWWTKLGQQKVVTVANLRTAFTTTTPAEGFLQSTAPYTIVAHWRQANKYLLSAQMLIVEENISVLEHGRFVASGPRVSK